MCKIFMFTEDSRAQAAHDDLVKISRKVFLAKGIDQERGRIHHFLYVPWELERDNPGVLDSYNDPQTLFKSNPSSYCCQRRND